MTQRFAVVLTLMLGALLMSTPAFATHGAPHSTLELRDPATGASTIDYRRNGPGNFSVAVQFQNNTAIASLQFDIEFPVRPSGSGVNLTSANIQAGAALVPASPTFRGQNFVKHELVRDATRVIHRIVITPSEDNQLLASGRLATLSFDVPTGLTRNETLRLTNVVASTARESTEPLVATSDVVINSGIPQVVLAPGSVLPKEITQNTTLQRGATYTVLYDLWIRTGATMTIEPGVNLQFNYDSSSSNGTGSGGMYRTQIIVQGAISIEGTVEAPVTLESWTYNCLGGSCTRAAPHKGEWDGIVIASNSPDNLISHAIIQWATWGVRFENGAARIVDSVIQKNLSGIDIAGSSAPDIQRTIITNNNAGIRVIRDATYPGAPVPQIYNNDIFGNVSESVSGGATGLDAWDVIGDGLTYNLVTSQAPSFQNQTADINAPSNWWGTNVIGSIAQTVIDVNDNAVLPRVNFVPFLGKSINSLRFPVANAGADFTINAGDTFSLDGRNSTDVVGIVSYAWSAESQLALVNGIQNPASAVATATVKPNRNGEKLQFTLVVKNSSGLLSTDTVSVFVRSGVMPTGLVAEGGLNGGAISANATFNGYYTIDGNVAVATGTTTTLRAGSALQFSSNSTVTVDGTLVIEPGVRLSFAKGAKLLVNGVLRVLGTAATPVQFTSTEASPARGSWQGIVLGPSSSGSIIQYANIQYATIGIDVQGATAEVRNSTLGEFAQIGISMSAGAGGVIADNTIDNKTNSGVGIYLKDTSIAARMALLGGVNTLTISGNQVLNTTEGVSINGLSNPSIINGNTIASNSLGIVIHSGGAGVTVAPVIEGNNIYDNRVYNIALQDFGNGGSATVNVSNNWWGTTNNAQIQSGILDSANYSQAPTVTYTVVLAAPTTSQITVAQPSDQMSLTGKSVTLQINASSSGGKLLSYSATGLPPGININPVNGLISGVISGSGAASFSPVVTISDGTKSVTVSFSWIVLVTTNISPVANAGINQSVNANVSVTLNGAGSSDSDGTIVSYSWVQVGGAPTVAITNAGAMSTTFIAPSVTVTTTLTFQLTVTDNGGATGLATVAILVSPVSGGGTTATTTIATGNAHALALQANGTVWQWGAGATSLPTLVGGLAGSTQVVAAGGGYSLALAKDGTVWGWGYNANGQLGTGNTVSATLPVQGAWSNITSLAVGWSSSFAVRSDGTLWAAGWNMFGQLGDGTTVDRTTPVQVSGLTNVIAVASNAYHSLALKGDGTVWAWGLEMYGEHGDGGAANSQPLIPVQVTGLTDVIAIAAGNVHSLALKRDGTVWAWGDNSTGQLGNGTALKQTTPVQVLGLAGVTALSASYASHNLAVKADGTVWTWGFNRFGQLGDGTTLNRNTPVPVLGLANVNHVAGGYGFSVAKQTDGSVWTWGRNDAGQLGDGTTLDRPTAAKVNGLP